MSSPQKYRKVISEIAARGTIGVALLLGATASAAASQTPVDQQATQAQQERVSERLAAIREAVSALTDAAAEGKDRAGDRVAWHNWGNGGGSWGWGRPWGNFNFGLPRNNWNNWRNGWHNWRNGWGNW